MLQAFHEVLSFSLSVTGPIFVLLALGVGLRRRGLLTDAFIDSGSRLVFNLCLPVLLFINVSKTDLSGAAGLGLVAFGLGMTLLVFLLLEWACAVWVQPEGDRGVVVQGGFRSNMGAIGLAYCMNAYGEAGVQAASLYLGLVTILFNVLAVITLSRSSARRQGVGRMLKGIAGNPLIIGILLGLAVAQFSVPVPALVIDSGNYLADLTLPLALLCTGAALDLRMQRQAINHTMIATLAKLVVVPFMFAAGGAWMGFRGVELGVLLLMSSAPTAAASYVMVRAMGGNATLAANIIATTTLGSLFSTSAGVMIMRGAGLI